MPFDRCATGGEHWWLLHGEHGHCRPKKTKLRPTRPENGGSMLPRLYNPVTLPCTIWKGGSLSIIVIPPNSITHPPSWNRIVTISSRSFLDRQTRPRLSRRSKVNSYSSENTTRNQRRHPQFWSPLHHSRLWAMWSFVKVGTTFVCRARRWATWRTFRNSDTISLMKECKNLICNLRSIS